MKLPKVHFQIIESEVSKGMDEANFARIMSAAAALKRYKEENRETSIEAASTDCLIEVSGRIRFVHKEDFFGEVLSQNNDQIFVKELGKRKFQKALAEVNQDAISISEIPEDVSLAVSI